MENIKLYKGDCLQVMQELINKGVKVDMILTDPPYAITTGGDSDGRNSKRPKGILSGNRELMKNIPKFSEWIKLCYDILRENSHAYFMTNSSNLLKMSNTLEEHGFKIHNFLVWEKNNCTPSQFYMKNCEYVIFCRKGKAKYINNIGGSKTVHKMNNVIGRKVHPTQKPVELMSMYINNSTNNEDLVLDPFMGSGSTGVACVNTKRKFIGIEIDDKYFEIAENRIKEAVNNKQL